MRRANSTASTTAMTRSSASASSSGSSGGGDVPLNNEVRALLSQSATCLLAAVNGGYNRTQIGRDDFMWYVAVVHCLQRGIAGITTEMATAACECRVGLMQEIALELGKNQNHFYCLDTHRSWPLTTADVTNYQRESLLGNHSATNNLGNTSSRNCCRHLWLRLQENCRALCCRFLLQFGSGH